MIASRAIFIVGAKIYERNQDKSEVAELSEENGAEPKEEKRLRIRSVATGKRDYSAFRPASQIRAVLDLAALKAEETVVTSEVADDFRVRFYGDTAVVTFRNAEKSQLKGRIPACRNE